MKLAITQIVLGALVAVGSFIYTGWGFPTKFTFPADEEGLVRVVFINPGPEYIAAQRGASLVMLLGLAVVGCGIFQLIKARRLKGAPSS